MISYIIAGSSDNQELAELENLCSCIKITHSNIKFKIISKHENDWPTYIKQICKIYGFYEMQNPICFTPLGELIGSTSEFKAMLEQKFGVSGIKLDIPDRVNESINQQLTQEKYDWDHRLVTLREKVRDRFERLHHREKFKFDREMFEKVEQGERKVYVKYVEDYTPEITIETNKPALVDNLSPYEVPFEIVDAINRKKDQIEDNHANHKTYQPNGDNETQPEMKLKSKTVSKEGSRYGDYIDEPASSRDVDQVKLPSKRRRSKDSMGLADKGMTSQAELSNIPPTQNDMIEQKFEATTPAEQSDVRGAHFKNSNMNTFHELQNLNGESKQELNYQLQKIKPVGINMREWIVNKLENNYYLAINPESVFKQQCLLIRGDKLDWTGPLAIPDKKIDAHQLVDQDNAQSKSRSQTAGITNTSTKPMVHFDFSHTQKIRVTNTNIMKGLEEEQEAQGTNSYLTSRLFDPKKPFSKQDLDAVEGLVNELDAFALYTVPPTKDLLARAQTELKEKFDAIQDKKRTVDKVLNHEKLEHLVNRNPNIEPSLEDIRIPNLPYLSHNVHIILRSILLEEVESQDELLDFERLISDPHNLICDLDREKDRLFSISLEQEQSLMRHRQLEREAFLRECKLKRELEQQQQEESKQGDGKKPMKTLEKNTEEAAKSEKVEDLPQDPLPSDEIKIDNPGGQGDEDGDNLAEMNSDGGNDNLNQQLQQEHADLALQQHIDETFDQQFLGKIFQIKSWKTLHKLYFRTGDEQPSDIANVISNIVKSILFDKQHQPEIDFDLNHSGFTYILSPKFVLLVVQNEPFYKYQENHMFLQPWSYLGFFTFPTFKKTWPQTYPAEDKSASTVRFENPLTLL